MKLLDCEMVYNEFLLLSLSLSLNVAAGRPLSADPRNQRHYER